MIKVITTTSILENCHNLERSLKHFDYDYHFIHHYWGGFLDKMHCTYNYLKSLEGYTHFIYTDAWDTFALRKVNEVPDGLMFSAERACYPHPDKEPLYPRHDSPWRYVNGGGWCGEIAAFIKMYEDNPPQYQLNDQVYLTDEFLKGGISLDYNCDIFQSVAFCPETDFEFIGATIRNTITNTFPAFFHGNGHTPIDHIYKLL